MHVLVVAIFSSIHLRLSTLHLILVKFLLADQRINLSLSSTPTLFLFLSLTFLSYISAKGRFVKLFCPFFIQCRLLLLLLLVFSLDTTHKNSSQQFYLLVASATHTSIYSSQIKFGITQFKVKNEQITNECIHYKLYPKLSLC